MDESIIQKMDFGWFRFFRTTAIPLLLLPAFVLVSCGGDDLVTPQGSINEAQMVHHTLMLYHLDDVDPLADSSLYTGEFEAPLDVDLPSALGAEGMAQGRLFNGTADFMSSPDNPKHFASQMFMTVEAFVKFNALPPKNTKMTIAAKTDGAIDHGWEFGLISQGGKRNYFLYFDGNPDRESAEVIKSEKLDGVISEQFYHVAVTWDQGLISFFFDGEWVGSKIVDSAGSVTLWPSVEPLRLGTSNGAGDFLDGVMDEVRISQVVRYSNSFTPPTSPFIAD